MKGVYKKKNLTKGEEKDRKAMRTIEGPTDADCRAGIRNVPRQQWVGRWPNFWSQLEALE